MPSRRVGLWLVGALGGVGSTVALGLAALAEGLTDAWGLVTATEPFERLDLDPAQSFVVGGHDIRAGRFLETITHLHQHSGVFAAALVEKCRPRLEQWSGQVVPGTLQGCNPTIRELANHGGLAMEATPRAAIDRLKRDLADFKQRGQLDQVVVLNVASTEPPFPLGEIHESMARLRPALESASEPSPLPASSLYALATLELGWPYVNFTPSLGANFPAALELAAQNRCPVAGQDGKTGETLLKSALAPMFAARNLKLLSWVGHNIFGNRDGQVLNDPHNKAAKIKTKDQIISGVVGYQPQTHVSIEYIESLDDWKTAWDHIHFQGFLGTKMTMQFTWQGCDSLLAAPLVIDLARLALLAQRRGEHGPLRHLAAFFKNPLGETDMDFFHQHERLLAYARATKGDA